MRKRHIVRHNKGHWESYALIDGLPDVNVLVIMEDREGYLWFGTEDGGVSRYDGQSFMTFTTENGLAGNNITSILEDREGYLWFGTGGWSVEGGGVSRYDGQNFVTFTAEDGLANNNVLCIMEDREGRLWFGTSGGGVSRYDGQNFVTFTTKDGLAHNDVRAILEDREGNLWFGTYYGGVSRYACLESFTKPALERSEGFEDKLRRRDGQNFVTFTTKDGLADDRITSILEDREGNLWFGTYYGGVSRYDGKSFVAFTRKNGLADNRVMSILEDREGYLWFGTYSGGVSCYNGTSFLTFTIEDGLANNRVNSILEDREGYLWLGTYGGASRYDRGIATFTTEDGLANNDVRSIIEDREGNLWFGTHGGVSCYDGKKFVTFTIEDGLARNDVRSIIEDRKGNLWFGTYNGGVSRYDSKSFVTFTMNDGLAGNHVWSILEDRKGNLWFGTYNGVSRYDGDSFVTFTTKDGLANNQVWSIVEDREGNLWFGTVDGVSRYDGNSFVTFTTKDGLADNHVWSISIDREGKLWFATKDGVSCYNGQNFQPHFSFKKKSMVKRNTKDGLSCKNIRYILEDRESYFWFGTNGGGVCKSDGKNFQDITTQDGLAYDTVRQIIQDKAGNLWFATPNRITKYSSPPQKVKPRVRITQVIADEVYENPDSIESPANQVIFEYKGLSFKTKFNRIKYIYKLEGRDADWSQATRERMVRYENIEPGEYLFQVRAIDRDLNYSDAAQVKLTVIPDPKNHRIAELESDLERRNQELEKANAELQRLNKFKSELLSVVSHELRTPLTSIDGFTRLIYERFLTEELITKCNEVTRPTIQRVKDRIAIIHENTSRLARLINDLLDFSRIERGRELEMHFTRIDLSDIIGSVTATYQAPAAEKQLTLQYDGEIPLRSEKLEVFGDADRLLQVLSNLVSNAVKFTPEGGRITVGARKVVGQTVSLSYGAFKDAGQADSLSYIELSVKDTGIGIPKEMLSTIFEPFEQAGGTDAKKSGTGLGLAIVKYIVDKHNGTVRVESEVGAGSTFIVALPEYMAELPVRTAPQRILIVDNDYDILRLLEEGLSVYPNTRIITASNSQDALKILETQPCDVMITDVHMPGDISGIEFAEKVKEKYPELKVFVMTNTPEEKERVIKLRSDWIDKATPNLIHYIAKRIGSEHS
jgi:signal transduction histidine kinase/ligand-binding sensor domain-containing protein/CheY-like chemotaxis protein